MNIDDELLVAYADGELDAQRAKQVERALTEDASLRARLQALTQAADLTRNLFEAKGREPVPPALIDAIMSAEMPSAEATEAVEKPSLRERLRAWFSIPVPAAALASVMLLTVGGVVGYLLPRAFVAPPSITTVGRVPVDSPMYRLLESHASGELLLSGDLDMEIVATFVDRGRVCREYRASQSREKREYHAGIACLKANRDWVIAFAVDDYLENEAVGGFYETASGKLHEAIDDYIEQHLGTEALDDEAERELLDSAWRLPR